jgi:hypothetical protein
MALKKIQLFLIQAEFFSGISIVLVIIFRDTIAREANWVAGRRDNRENHRDILIVSLERAFTLQSRSALKRRLLVSDTSRGDSARHYIIVSTVCQVINTFGLSTDFCALAQKILAI